MNRRTPAFVGIVLACFLLGLFALRWWHPWDRSAPRTNEQSTNDTKSGDVTASSPNAIAPGAADGSVQVELCGYGKTRPIRTTDDYPLEVVRAAEGAFSSAAERLSAQAQPAARAVGLYARLVAAVRRAGDENQRVNPNCTDAPCVQRRLHAASDAAKPHAEELARLAVASHDPRAYSMARFGCRLNRDSGACAQLSVGRWAQLEPDNAVPWFYLAEEAAARKDEAALSEALYRAGRAKTSDYHWSAIFAMAEDPAARELAPASRLVYLSQLLGIYAALPAPTYLAVGNACSPDNMADSTRRQLCVDLATMMTERSKSLHEHSLGAAIGERGGWPADRVQRLRDEKDAINVVDRKDWVPEDVHSCRFLEQLEARINELVKLGELASVRQKLAASGRSVGTMAQEWRDSQRRDSNASKGTAGSK